MTESAGNRRILVRHRPNGLIAESDLELITEPLPALNEGEARVRTQLLAMDPVTRVMLTADIGVMPPIPLGAAVRGFGAGEVVASLRQDLPVGARVSGFFDWADYQHVPASMATSVHFRTIPDGIPLDDALNLHGHTALAAYFGMIDVGRVGNSDTVVVTGAAGAVGSIAGQIAKIKGARVVGIAGGPEKCRWLVTELGFDTAIDYKSADFEGELLNACGDGIDVTFDNIGGPILDTLIDRLNSGARVVLCGSIAQYLGENPLASTHDLALVAARGAVASRFNAMSYADRFDAAIADMLGWQRSGRLRFPQQIVDGLRQAPKALNRLFTGQSRGRLLVRMD